VLAGRNRPVDVTQFEAPVEIDRQALQLNQMMRFMSAM